MCLFLQVDNVYTYYICCNKFYMRSNIVYMLLYMYVHVTVNFLILQIDIIAIRVSMFWNFWLLRYNNLYLIISRHVVFDEKLS